MRFASCPSPEKIEDILHGGEDDDCRQGIQVSVQTIQPSRQKR
jgi:hypothetical protein